jgi:hypothetical protein
MKQQHTMATMAGCCTLPLTAIRSTMPCFACCVQEALRKCCGSQACRISPCRWNDDQLNCTMCRRRCGGWGGSKPNQQVEGRRL